MNEHFISRLTNIDWQVVKTKWNIWRGHIFHFRYPKSEGNSTSHVILRGTDGICWNNNDTGYLTLISESVLKIRYFKVKKDNPFSSDNSWHLIRYFKVKKKKTHNPFSSNYSWHLIRYFKVKKDNPFSSDNSWHMIRYFKVKKQIILFLQIILGT